MPSTTSSARATFHSCASEKLSTLWPAVMGRARPAQAQELLAAMVDPWGYDPVPRAPRWLSDIGEDHSPIEFSVAIGGAPELRILVEAQAAEPTPRSHWKAAGALSERLERDYGVDLTRFRQIEDLFEPTDPHAVFAMWHAVCLWPERAPAWKIYLNPQGQGRGNAVAVVQEALARLGYPKAWATLARSAMGRGESLDELKYFSIDLSAEASARIKIYFRHHQVATAELEEVFALAKNHQPGAVTEFCQAMAASEGRLCEKPIQSCHAFLEGDTDRPSTATLYLPVDHYAPDDACVRHRICAYMDAQALPRSSYERPLEAFARRPLEGGSGMHSYVSLRWERGRPRLTIYLATEIFSAEQIDTSLLRSIDLTDLRPSDPKTKKVARG